MKLRILQEARLDAQDAARRLNREHEGYGKRFTSLFRKAVAAIRATPRLFSPTDDGPEDRETREFFIETFEYRVIYLIWQNEVFIVAVIHAARNPGRWATRISDILNS